METNQALAETPQTGNNANTQAQNQTSRLYGLKQLDRLVGTWQVSGPEISGRVTFEWMEGGFFLLQHIDLAQHGQQIKGLEIIGYQRGWEALQAGDHYQPSQHLTSYYFDNAGNTFSYTYELDNDTLTIWGGEKGSPAYYQGKWSDDGNTNSGAWVYPGGGGYASTMTRIPSVAGKHKQMASLPNPEAERKQQL